MSHKLAGELPLSDSLTEHTLLPARIVLSSFLRANPNFHLSPLSVVTIPLSSTLCLAPRLPPPSLFHPLAGPRCSRSKIKVYKMFPVCRWNRSANIGSATSFTDSEGTKGRDVDTGVQQRENSPRRRGDKEERSLRNGGHSLASGVYDSCGQRGEGRTRKVETTCRNNVRVFDLKHVTEPHWNQIGARERTLNWLWGTGKLTTGIPKPGYEM